MHPQRVYITIDLLLMEDESLLNCIIYPAVVIHDQLTSSTPSNQTILTWLPILIQLISCQSTIKTISIQIKHR